MRRPAFAVGIGDRLPPYGTVTSIRRGEDNRRGPGQVVILETAAGRVAWCLVRPSLELVEIEQPNKKEHP
jgi:hypothetical protein